MKIYDCFIFFNELDLLELRLRILDKVVDYFVIVEAKKTHSGKDKPLNFLENKERFKKWENKIIYVIPEKLPLPTKIYFKDNWRMNSVLGIGRFRPEIAQRKCVKEGLKKAKNEDLVIISDLDEIPNPKKIDLIKKLLKDPKNKVICLNQKMYYYYLNGLKQENWPGPRVCTYKTFKNYFGSHSENLRRLRSMRLRLKMKLNKGVKNIKEGGWHFSYLGNPETISEKIKSISHVENDREEFTSVKKIKNRVNEGLDLFGRKDGIKYVPIDDSFPLEIRKNKKKYSKFIRKI